MRKISLVALVLVVGLSFQSIESLAEIKSNKSFKAVSSATAVGKPKLKKRRFKRLFNKAIDAYYQEQYTEALELFKKILKKEQDRPSINFFVGVCMDKLEMSKLSTLSFFEKASKRTVANYMDNWEEINAPAYANYYLAQVYQSMNKQQEAIHNYLAFRKQIPSSNTKLLTEVNQKLQECYNAIALMSNPINVNVELLPVSNTTFSDYGAQLSNDGKTLYFTSRRLVDIDDNGRSKSDIYYMNKEGDKWGAPVKLDVACSASNDNFCCLSADENFMFFSTDRDFEQYDIYYCVRLVETNKWSEPRKLSDNVNSPTANETNAWLSQNWKTLYFVSDRTGGQGGRDIYSSTKIGEADFAPAQNMGAAINTSFDEKSPYITEDGKEFYFSSRGHQGIGGFDVYCSKNDDGQWAEAMNLGFPINTTVDDHYFSKSPDGKTVMYSSAKKGVDVNNDIYLIKNYSSDMLEKNMQLLSQVKVTDSVAKKSKMLLKDKSSVYTVQVGAGVKMKVSVFNVMFGVRECMGVDGLKRYIIGEFANKEDAQKMRDEIINLGFNDAWTPVIDVNRYECE